MIQEAVGMRIRNMRLERNLSQEKLALDANIDRTYLSGVEKGSRNISIANLEKIISALNTTFEVFFKGM